MTWAVLHPSASDAEAKLVGLGVYEHCRVCHGGHMTAIEDVALLGFRRRGVSELLSCVVMRCGGCGNIALFDATFVEALGHDESDVADVAHEIVG
jgi:hypothetical protein